MYIKKNSSKFSSKLKFLTILAMTAYSISTVHNYSNAIESTADSSISVNKNNSNFRLDDKYIEKCAKESAEKFLKKLEFLKQTQGKDLNKVKIVLIARGGNHDMHDDKANYFNNKKVNHGLDFLCYDIADYLESLSSRLTDGSVILPIIVDQADFTVTELNSVRDKHYNILPALELLKSVDCNDAYNVDHFGGNFYKTSTQFKALQTFFEHIAEKIGYRVETNQKGKKSIVAQNNENKNIPLIYLMINAADIKTDGVFNFEYLKCGRCSYRPGFVAFYNNPSDIEGKKLCNLIVKHCSEDCLKKNSEGASAKTECDNSNLVQCEKGKMVPAFAQNANLAGALSFVGFGDVPNEQKKILDPDTMNRLAMQYAKAIAEWFNIKPATTNLTIEPAYSSAYYDSDDNDSCTYVDDKFIVTAHFKNIDPSNLKKGFIVVVKADPNLDENSWNEAKSKATPLNIVQEKDSDDYKMINTFNISDFEGCKNFYIKIFDEHGLPIISDITSFIFDKKSNGTVKITPNNFTKFDLLQN